MTILEKESDRYILFNDYYILILNIGEIFYKKSPTKSEKRSPLKSESSRPLNVHDLAKKLLSRNTFHQPLATYVFGNSIFLVYSCVDEEQTHYKDGSHHKIISEYVSMLSIELKRTISGSIVELDTRTSVSTYFAWKIHSNSLEFMVEVSKGQISLNDTKTKTMGELTIILQDNDVDWNSASLAPEKYGVFYKLKKKKGKVVIVDLSELFDSRDMKKYTNFIFG